MAGKRAPVKLSILADAKDAVRSFDKAGDAATDMGRDFDKAGDAATDMGRDFDKAGDAAKRSARDFDKVADAAGDTASASSQIAGGLGDVAGALAATGFISEDAAAKVDTWSQSIMGVTGVADLAEVTIGKLRLATIGQTIAEKARAAATLAGAAAQKVATAAQWALNIAMRANPIGLLIAGIAALIFIIPKVVKHWDSITAAMKRVWSFIKGAFKAGWEGIKKTVSTVVDWFKKAVPAGFKAVVNTLKNLWRPLGSFVGDTFGFWVDQVKAIPGKIAALGGRFKEVGKGLMNKMIEGIKNAAGFIGNIASGIWNAVKGLLNQAITRINRALEFRISLPLGKSITINPPDIPHLAKGGIVTRPTLAVIGEAGPEAVIPLNGRHSVGDTYVIHQNGTYIGGSQREVGRWLADALDAYLGRGGARRAS